MNDSATKNRIRSPLLFIGLFFLINPYFAMLDILPDFIGYALICYAVSDLAKLEYRMESAMKYSAYLGLLSFARAVAFVLSLGSDDSMRLLLTFSFGVAEILLVIRFASDLFGGTEYLLERYDGYEALGRLNNARFLTLLFLIVKVVLGVIPEAAVLLVQKVLFSDLIDVDDIPLYNDIASYKPYATALFILITLILGVWWYIEICRYFGAVRKDAAFVAAATKAAEYVTGSSSESIDKKLSVSYVFAIVGIAAFALDVRFERVPVLPAFLGALISAYAIIRAKRGLKKALAPYALCAAATGLALDVCFILFGSTDTLGTIAESAVLAALGAAFAVCSVLFVRRLCDSLRELHADFGCEKTSLKPLVCAEIIYTIYALLNIAAFSTPVLYPWLLLPRILLSVAFIAVFLLTYRRICEEYVALVSDAEEET